MVSVIVLGSGNVGSHLIKAFEESSDIDLKQVYSRKKSSLRSVKKSISTTTNLSNLKKADIYIIAIPDDEIKNFSKKLAHYNGLMVHTSGSVSLNSLDTIDKAGVFYPLQTFSKSTAVNFKDIPICIEATNNKDLLTLKKLASAISDSVYILNTSQRKSIHLAAVFVNNFVNHMYQMGNAICDEHQVPFKILEPLIQETAKKMIDLSPYKAQTGPARRNDQTTIEAHLEMLSKKEKEIYQLVTNSIKSTYGKKL